MAALALVALWAPAVRAQEDAELLPRATRLERVTWTRSRGLTRLEFHGTSLVPPVVAVPAPDVLRIDFTAADAAAVPQRLDIGTDEVASVLRIPQLPGVLPEGVSARFLVRLSSPGASWSVEPGDFRVLVFIGTPEKASGGGLQIGSSYYAEELQRATGGRQVVGEPAAAADRLPGTMAFVVTTEQPIRATPSAVSAEVGHARKGETKLADAVREDWVHLVGGGWLRQPALLGSASPSASPGPALPPSRTSAAWSVVTLGTGLQAELTEVMPGAPDAEPIVRLFRDPVRLARLVIRVQPGNLAFVLPPKKGRVQAELGSGTTVNSLDPRELALTDQTRPDRVEELFDAPPIGSGDAWETMIVFPGDFDFLAVREMRLDVGGMMQKLFRIPGSGERLEAGTARP